MLTAGQGGPAGTGLGFLTRSAQGRLLMEPLAPGGVAYGGISLNGSIPGGQGYSGVAKTPATSGLSGADLTGV